MHKEKTGANRLAPKSLKKEQQYLMQMDEHRTDITIPLLY